MTLDNLVREILTGTHDADLDSLLEAVQGRVRILRTIQSQELKATARAGQHARIKNIRPSYLIGQEVEIVSTDRGGNRVNVRLLRPVGRFGTHVIGCPAASLELIEAAPARS